MISNVVDVVAIGKKYFFHGFGVVNLDTVAIGKNYFFHGFGVVQVVLKCKKNCHDQGVVHVVLKSNIFFLS